MFVDIKFVCSSMNLAHIMRSCTFIQGDSLARGPRILSIKHYVIEIMTKIYIHILGKQDLLIIDAENGLISQPSTLKCVYI
jgi:hypothetical protein